VVNVNAQNANAIYQNIADYNRFENAFKTGGVTKQLDKNYKMVSSPTST
jgi:hypothetical protein